jgi:nifR3 family TIM-barrel protein
MEMGFWKKLKKPIMVLAPMADVTDCAFRQLIAKYGKPDVTWTEFVSADGLCSPGREVLVRDLVYTDAERPIVAQLFTAHPDKMREAAALAARLGFDGIDINMGCPDKSIEKQGAGAAMIKNPKVAREVIRAAKEGAAGLPVSVKTRIGYSKDESKDEIDTWIPELLAEDIAALTIHARTRKEMSEVPAHWDKVSRVIELRDRLAPQTLILGNGDAKDVKDAIVKAEESGADGVMLGRAIFGNPWLFKDLEKIKKGEAEPYAPSVKEKLEVMVEHTLLYEKLLGDIKNFVLMKKHYKAYVNGFDGAKELRMRLMDTQSATEVQEIVEGYLSTL